MHIVYIYMYVCVYIYIYIYVYIYIYIRVTMRLVPMAKWPGDVFRGCGQKSRSDWKCSQIRRAFRRRTHRRTASRI